MLKYILTSVLAVTSFCSFSQNYTPFSIYSAGTQPIIAGAVSSSIYTNYYGRNVQQESYSDVHDKPEYLVYEQFKNMKERNVTAISKLYDNSFSVKNFDTKNMDMLKDYSDIKFQSRFSSGDIVLVRYDFISATKSFPYFAFVKKSGNKFYLTAEFSFADPFNIIGALSPNNLFDKAEKPVNTKNMTSFYFISRQNKIFFTDKVPQEDHTALYLAFESGKKLNTAETDFINQLISAAKAGDSVRLKSMISADERSSLGNYFTHYQFQKLVKIMQNFSGISPIAALNTEEGKVVYFRYTNPEGTKGISSVILKKLGGKNYLSFRISNTNVDNILQNDYIKEAIYNYFKNQG